MGRMIVYFFQCSWSCKVAALLGCKESASDTEGGSRSVGLGRTERAKGKVRKDEGEGQERLDRKAVCADTRPSSSWCSFTTPLRLASCGLIRRVL